MKKTNYKIALIIFAVALLLIIVYFFIALPKSKKTVPQISCKKAGCSGQLCLSSDAKDTVTNCEWKPEYGCYKQATCERQPDGQCGFTQSESLRKCLNQTYSEFETKKLK